MLSYILKNHMPVEIDNIRSKDFIAQQKKFELEKIENVQRGSGWKKVNVCPLCSSRRNEKEIEIHNIPLLHCKECDLRFHSKIPADPNDIYQDSDYKVYTKGESKEHFEYRRNRFGKERIKLLERHCGDLSKKKLLDVGCGDGYFLSVANKVCGNCFGSEFSIHLKKQAEANTGVKVFGDSLTNFPEKNFDIITAFDVIEHISEPLSFMHAVKNLLNPGGFILLFTPNFDSFSIRVIGEYSSILDGTEHVIIFNHSSLRFLGNILKLEVKHTETKGLDISSIISFYSFLGNGGASFLSRWTTELQAMIDEAACADYMRILYKKVDL